jgi:tetratricopeptide (TPR) repeat protein
LDERIKCKIKNQSLVIDFSDLGDYSSESIKLKGSKSILEGDNIDFIVTSWTKGNSQMLEQLRQNLMFMKNHSSKTRYDAQLILFKSIAANYRALKVKPAVSEEQRKLIVQANAFNQQKMYDKAIELYNKAIAVDQTAYPAGYSNLALLSAQINNFDAAICNMKKYLLLEPEGSDARSAQDKIYEWEGQIQ